MANIDSLRRQPDSFDFAQSSQFKVTLGIFPLTEYFTTSVTIPGVGLGIEPMEEWEQTQSQKRRWTRSLIS